MACRENRSFCWGGRGVSSFETSWGPVLRYVREGRLAVRVERLAEDEGRERPAVARLREPLEIWRGLPREGDLPHRRELRPERFPGFLPKLCIIELFLKERDFRWALHGGEHEYWLGRSLKGLRASDIGDAATWRLRDAAFEIYESRRPGLIAIDYYRGEATYLRATILCLPFRVDTPATGVLLCPAEFEPLHSLDPDELISRAD
ncbi:MAG: PAS domain-containing protein [Alphaproteobacteria bacterium]|nr:MAG: PAS domain-containing protein [Alphaproteobacteria bacterium]